MSRIASFASALRKKKTLLSAALILIVAVIALALFLPRTHRGPREFTIVARDGSFSPNKITVVSGDTVVFKNEEKVGVWPASDPHPTHEFYPGFDPYQPVPAGGSWSFTFKTPGEWGFHDHLNVTAHGTITVVAAGAKAVVSKYETSGSCDGKCFDDMVKETVDTKGIDAAYALFQEAYDSGTLPRSCHWTAHRIGEEAYKLFKAGKDIEITKATSYCAFGFYHGFMESLLRENPDPAYALEFCKKVEAKVGAMGLQNCYHGIGHGYTEDPPDPKVIGDFKAMIAPGTKMCEYLFGKNFNYLNLCLTGVFTVPAGFAAEGKYGLSIDAKDPFKYCKDQPERYWKACYGEFAPKLDGILNGDLRKLPPYVDSLKDDRLKRLVTWVVPSVTMSRDITNPDHSKYIDDCRADFTGNYRNICWGGAILGFFSHGKPEEEYKPVLDFCASNSWRSEDERRFCYGEGFREMRRMYTIDKVKTVCALIPSQYQDLCLDEAGKHVSPYDDPSFAAE